MTPNIPEFVTQIANQFADAGFEIYLVGGCVRDLLLNRTVKDWDFTTNATPEQIQQLFPDSFYDNQFGTVGIPIDLNAPSSAVILGNEVTPESDQSIQPTNDSDKKNKTVLPAGRQVIEVTTYRTEKEYLDRRRPSAVEWGKTIEEDLSRRDFTINAIALKLNNIILRAKSRQGRTSREDNSSQQSSNNIDFEIIDPYDGQKDLENKLICAVGDPQKRFKEDALRLMRAIRLATQLSFSIETQTLTAITQDASLIGEIAAERVRDELMKILASDYPYEGIMLLRNTKLLEHILPELLEGEGVSQERPGRHHTTDVFTHNVMSLKHTPSKDPVVRFATLVHDIAKPRVASSDQEGLVIFHNHEIVGAKMATDICDRLRFSKKEKEKIVMLIRWHMFTVDEHITDAAIRRFIRRVGVEYVRDMIDLRIGDRLGSGTQTAESWRLKLFKERIEKQLAPAPFSINDLAIDGNDVMKELGIKPGPKIGEILEKLFEEVDEDLSKNTKKYLTQRLHEITNSLA